MADLSIVFLGKRFPNPTVLASGIMGVSASSMLYAIQNGAGAATMKSLGLEPRKGHPNPVIATFEAGMINAVGLSGPGVDEGKKEIEEFRKRSKGIIIASVFAFKSDEYFEVVRRISSSKPDLIEINISCPNVESEGGTPFALDCLSAARATEMARKATDIPIIVKLSPTAPDIAKIAISVEKAGADAINMGNTLGPGMVINPELAKPVLSNKVGGVSGAAIRPIAVKKVWDIYKAVKIPIIGTGGVSTGRDAVEMIMAGATLVGIGAAVHDRGIDVFAKVCGELSDFMEKNGYSSIQEMVGKAHE